MTMPLDPYAPPTASAEGAVAQDGRGSDYAAEKRSLLVVILLSVGTLFLYFPFWMWRRQPFLDRLDSDKKLGSAPTALIVATFAVFGLAFFDLPESFSRAVDQGLTIAGLILSFRVAAMLRSDFARSGRMIDVKGVWVFLFGPIYLQHVINKAADTPARIEGAKKRKKRKKRADAKADADAGADVDAGADARA